MFVAIFEGELGDAGFVEIAEAFGDRAIVLFLGRARAADRDRVYARVHAQNRPRLHREGTRMSVSSDRLALRARTSRNPRSCDR